MTKHSLFSRRKPRPKPQNLPTSSVPSPVSHSPDPKAPLLPPAPTGSVSPGLAVLILCAGEMCLWEDNSPRQFWSVGSETVLGRIVRQSRQSGGEPIIVTHRQDLRENSMGCQYFEPERRRTIAETWLYTRELWREQTVILLGDVVFGELTMKNSLAYRGPMKMIGNSAEIFAFTFPEQEHERVAKMLYQVNAETKKGSPHLIYRCWCGLSYTNGNLTKGSFQWVWDRTTDIDSREEYEAARKVWG